MAKTAAALHILVKEEALAKEILAKLAKGGNFQELAKKHSTCPSGRKGGDLGEFRQGQMVPAFDKAVFVLAPCRESKRLRANSQELLHVMLQ